MNLSSLVQKIQDERAAVALNIFLDRPTSDDMQDLQIMVRQGMDLGRFTLMRTFNATDTVLQNVTTWPDLGVVEFFESKLKFQIQHSIFRTKACQSSSGPTSRSTGCIPCSVLRLLLPNCVLSFLKVRDSGKSIFEVLEWYNDIINFFIDYISLSIHDSDISEFYRYIIGFKNLLRCAHFLNSFLSRV